MKAFLNLVSIITLAAAAGHDPRAKLTKPPLNKNLDNLEKGLSDNLPETNFTTKKWTNDQIPSHCSNEALMNHFSPKDFSVVEVTYHDCSKKPWIFCHHKDAEVKVESMASQFGKIPIQMRQYIRHVMAMPAKAQSAYNVNGNIVFLQPRNDMLRVFIHEIGHSLDADAYKGGMSKNDNWWDNYDKDANAIDNYGTTTMIEEVAQAHVLAVYDEVVPGKYGSIEPKAANVHHQYATIITQAREQGKGKTTLTPGLGKGEQCKHDKQPSKPVAKKAGNSRIRREILRARGERDVKCTLEW